MREEWLISDAAKEVQVESHVLRYWEEELGLSIQRNEWGHRFYVKEDIDRLKRIKDLKERGLQLKAIKMLMMAGRLEAFESGGYALEEERGMAIEILEVRDAGEHAGGDGKSEEKAERSAAGEKDERATVAEEDENGTVEETTSKVAIEKKATTESVEEVNVPRRDETYFKKIDQLLRDKCFLPKKKRHFIF